jgi:hypothetical protein
MSLNAEERASIIAKAMDRSFGELLVWKRPVLAHSFGENDLGQIDIFEAALEKIRADVVFAYEQMSNDDLIQMDLELSDNFRISENNRAALSVKEIERLRRFVPLPIAYGFGHPAFAAKFEHWARMPRLSLHEVALLSLGADPSCMRDDKFADLKKTRDSGKPLWAAHASFLEQREIFSRCYHFTGYGYVAEPIGSIKRWIDDLGIKVHPQFYEGLEARLLPKDVQTAEPAPLTKSISSQERETLFKLIAAMAVKGYMFDPGASRNPATADIQSDLDQLGISLDQKTILKWVREACEIIPKGGS